MMECPVKMIHDFKYSLRPNKDMKWIPEPVALFAGAKNPPEPLTAYVVR
jgi:hypothetical protein